MAEKLLANYDRRLTFNNTANNAIGATTNITLRTVTTHTDLNSIYVRKFGDPYLITQVTDIEDPVDVNMTFTIKTVDGLTTLGSRVGGGAFVAGDTLTTAGAVRLDVVASGGGVTVLGTILVDTDVDVGGIDFVCATETVADSGSLPLYLSSTTSTYYDIDLKHGGARHTPDSTSILPYFDITTAIADPDVTGFTICTVLDSATYDEQFSISIAGMILQSALGQTPIITSGTGARISREVEYDGNNTDTMYVSKTGRDAGRGSYQDPFLTIQRAETIAAHSYIKIMDSETYEEDIAIDTAVSIEPLYGFTPTLKSPNTGTNVVTITHISTNIYGLTIDGNFVSTRGVYINITAYAGTIKDNTIFNTAIQQGATLVVAGIGTPSVATFLGTISYNKIYGNDVGVLLYSIGGAVTGVISYNHIYSNDSFGIKFNAIDTDTLANNNLCYLNGSGGIFLDCDNFGGTFENNTCWKNAFGIDAGISTAITGTISDCICWDNTSFDLRSRDAEDAVITESNYGTNSGFDVSDPSNITTDPKFCKTTSPFELGISADSGAYRTGTGNDDMGAKLRMIEINESNIIINGFNIDGQEFYNNAIYILDSTNHTGNINKWCTIEGFQGIAGDPYDDNTDTACQFLNCIFKNNGNGLKLTRGGNTVRECLFFRNSVFNIHSDYTGQIINHNVLWGAQYGIYFESNTSSIVFKNNIIAENSIEDGGIFSEISLTITYCCIIDGVNSNVDKSSDTNIESNPLFVNTNVDSEDFNIKTIQQGFSFDSPCKETADDSKDIGAYDVTRSVNTDAWKKYEFEFNPPGVTFSLNAKGFRKFEGGTGAFDSFAKGHKRVFELNWGIRNQVSSEELRQKIEYFTTLMKTRENEIIDDEKTKFRLHFQPTSFLANGTGVITTSNNNIADSSKSFIENQYKGFHVGVKWESGTNMSIDSVAKTGTVGGASWTVNEWIGYFTYVNGYYYRILSNTASILTFSDPDETLVTEVVDWNIEKYFKISANTSNALCVADPDSELVDGSFDYYIDFIEVKSKNAKFGYNQPVFVYDRERTKVNYSWIVEEV